MTEVRTLIGINDLIGLSGLSRMTIYRMRKAGVLPKEVRLGVKESRVAWYLDEIYDFINSRRVN